MAKNYMADVAKMLGVEIGEEFKVEKCGNNLYKITENGLEEHHVSDYDGYWNDTAIIGRILNAELGIIKLPWKPKIRDIYFHTSVVFKGVEMTRWDAVDIDYAMLALGMCYRTREEAEEHFAEDYKKLTGKELENG